MYQKIKLTILLFLFAISITAQNWGNSERIKGNGKIITVSKKTSDYDEVSVGGSFDVVLVTGKEGNISIEGEENIIPYIELEVKNDNLQIKYKRNTNIYTTKKLIITVPISIISKVSLGGSGSITNKNLLKTTQFSASLGGSGKIKLMLEAAKISANIGGSGNIELWGKTDEFVCSVAGSGNVNAYKLYSKKTIATVAGSGNIKTTVSATFKAKVVGSGNIYYQGNPSKQNLKSIGSGDIIKKK